MGRGGGGEGGEEGQQQQLTVGVKLILNTAPRRLCGQHDREGGLIFAATMIWIVKRVSALVVVEVPQ